MISGVRNSSHFIPKQLLELNQIMEVRERKKWSNDDITVRNENINTKHNRTAVRKLNKCCWFFSSGTVVLWCCGCDAIFLAMFIIFSWKIIAKSFRSSRISQHWRIHPSSSITFSKDVIEYFYYEYDDFRTIHKSETILNLIYRSSHGIEDNQFSMCENAARHMCARNG